jgi:polyferredoxin
MLRKLLWAYAIAALLTLAFQIWVRTGVCGDACALSYGKAIVWAIIWPASWFFYLRGL